MRNRRGAIVVMTGVFIVALMIIAAITVDASRIFAAKNELQTASDAAALAGALQLLEDPDHALDTALAYAGRNLVEQDAVDSVEVEYGLWLPAEREFVVGGEPKDAMRVTTRHPLPLSLARIFGDSIATVTASAIAWAAGPVMEPQCLKPIAVPYSRLLQVLGYQPWTNVSLTDDDIRRLREMSVEEKKWHFHFGDLDNEDEEASEYGEDHFKRDQYFPIDIDSTWDRNDPATHTRPSIDTATYRSYVAGPPDGRCSAKVRPGDEVRSEPAPKIGAVRNGLAQVCATLGGTLESSGTRALTCQAGGARVEMPLRVTYWTGYLPDPDLVPWYDSGAGSILVTRMTGSFVVDSLDWDPGHENYHGRMHGHFDVQRDFGVVDETVTSTLLRPVLVR